jgi:hypothetical protein
MPLARLFLPITFGRRCQGVVCQVQWQEENMCHVRLHAPFLRKVSRGPVPPSDPSPIGGVGSSEGQYSALYAFPFSIWQLPLAHLNIFHDCLLGRDICFKNNCDVFMSVITNYGHLPQAPSNSL